MAKKSSDSRRSIVLEGNLIEYKLQISKQTKNIRFAVKVESGLTITVPFGLSLKNVDAVIHSKKEWILANLKKMAEKQVPERKFTTGERLPLLGNTYVLVVEEAESNRISAVLQDGAFLVKVPAFLSAQERKKEIAGILEQWYVREARSVIPRRVAEINRGFGFAYNRIAIKNQQTRWGSCSQLKNLNFNWRLLLAPPHILDYIIVHELAHLKELNHSKRFWDLVESLFPRFREAEKWLKENGAGLKLV